MGRFQAEEDNSCHTVSSRLSWDAQDCISKTNKQTRPHKAPSNTGPNEMDQHVRALDAKPVDLISIPGSTQCEERPNSHQLSSDLYMCIMACMHVLSPNK